MIFEHDLFIFLNIYRGLSLDMLIVGRFTANELFEQKLVRHLLLVSIFIFAVAFVSSDSVFGHVTCLGRWKRDS